MHGVAGELIDISTPLFDGVVRWPGDPPTRVERLFDTARGDPATMSLLALGAHTGTHVDAPLHYFAGGASVDRMPPAATVGPCRVAELPDRDRVTAADLRAVAPRPGERLLLKTRNSARRWEAEPFDGGYACLTADAAAFLAERGVLALGVDYLSVGPEGEEGDEVHRTLLAAEVWIVEGLQLHGVEPGEYELLCLPLRLVGAEGAPARAFLRGL